MFRYSPDVRSPGNVSLKFSDEFSFTRAEGDRMVRLRRWASLGLAAFTKISPMLYRFPGQKRPPWLVLPASALQGLETINLGSILDRGHGCVTCSVCRRGEGLSRTDIIVRYMAGTAPSPGGEPGTPGR